MIIPAWR